MSSSSSSSITPPAALVSGSAGRTTDDQANATERRAQGEFVRGVSTARNWITTAKRNDDSNTPFYPPESGRYHLYVAYNCPWCHRVLLARAIMGLQDAITVDVAFPNRSQDTEPLGPNLWKFAPDGAAATVNGRHVSFPSCTKDTVNGKTYVKEIYELAGITDQKSVPILFDKQTKTIVSNESAEIVRMFGTAMKEFAKYQDVDLYPAELASQIDQVNDWIYTDIANGSYKAGFSSNQDVYAKAYRTFFDGLERVNEILSSSRFIAGGESVTEADVRLFPPLFRFDPIYYSRFKLNEKFLWEYKHIWRWMGDMMRLPGMSEVANREYLQHCKQGYFGRTGNGVVPLGPYGYPEIYLSAHPFSNS